MNYRSGMLFSRINNFAKLENNDLRNNSIDLLRAIAIILVVSIHTAQNFQPLFDLSTQIPKSYGQNGVQLFFIISGYTMLLTYGNSYDFYSAIAFYVRRIFRIVPMFWLSAVVYFFQYGFSPRAWAPGGISWEDIFLAISFLGWLKPVALNSVIPGGWSIVNEMLFYSVFPFFFFLITKKFSKLPYLILVTIQILGVFFREYYLQDYFSVGMSGADLEVVEYYFYFWIPAQIVCFGFGFILFELIKNKSLNKFAIILLSLSSYKVFGLILFVLFIFSYFVLSVGIQNRFLSLIGQASYSIYLIHFGVISIISFAVSKIGISLPFELAYFVIMCISLYISGITKNFIEDRFIVLGKKYAQRIQQYKAIQLNNN